MIIKLNTIGELYAKYPDYGCHMENSRVKDWKHLLQPLLPYVRGKRMFILFETMYFLAQKMYPRPYCFILMPDAPEPIVRDILTKGLNDVYGNWNYLTTFALTSAPVKTLDEAAYIEMPPEEGLAVFYDMNLTSLLNWVAADITIKGMEGGTYSGMYPEVLYDPETGKLLKTGKNYLPIFNEVMGEINAVFEPHSFQYPKRSQRAPEKNTKKTPGETPDKQKPAKESPASEAWKVLSALKKGMKVSYGWRETGTVLSVNEGKEYVRLSFDQNDEKIYVRGEKIKDIKTIN